MLTLTSSVASCFSVEYSVVVLPEPVGPVTSTMPDGRWISSSQVCVSSVRESEFGVAAHDDLGIEDPHDELFAECRRQRRKADLDLAAGIGAGRDLGLDTAVLRPTLLDDVHASEQFDAARHRGHHAGRHLVHLVQHAVDAEARHAELAARLQMDVAGALIERVLQQPVDDMYDVRVVGLDLAAELDQLLEARHQRSRA